MELFDLERFVKAQDAYDTFNTALQEIKNGSKESYWMWYIFPQIRGLGHSPTSQKFGIMSLLEAKAYLEHDVLGNRLYEAMHTLPVFGDAEDIFGELDAMKLRSCLTLFDIVSPGDIFEEFLGNYYNNERCQFTLKIVDMELSNYNNDNAFKRNGVKIVPRAFFEGGVVESESATLNQKIGTILDLLRRGETMRKLISRYLWDKDFSAYRVSGIESELVSNTRYLFQKISDTADDEQLFKKLNDFYVSNFCSGQNIFMIAESFDKFFRTFGGEQQVKTVLESYIKESLCK